MPNNKIDEITSYEKIIDFVFSNGEKLIKSEIKRLDKISHHLAWEQTERFEKLLSSLPAAKEIALTRLNKEPQDGQK